MIKSHRDCCFYVQLFMLNFNSPIDNFSAARSSESEMKLILIYLFQSLALKGENNLCIFVMKVGHVGWKLDKYFMVKFTPINMKT